MPTILHGDVSTRIREVEHNLTPGIRIQGQPVPRWSLAERMRFYRVPGLSVAVVNDGEIDWAKSYGLARVGGPLVTARTLFQAASISKPITAIGALCLVERGLLDLDEDVNRWLTTWQVPENEHTAARKVSLRGLLSHTAGVGTPGFWGYPPGAAVPTLRQVLDGTPPAVTPPVRVAYPPGTRFAYSGGGGCIVQQLCEDVTKRPFAALFDDLLFKPLGMADSVFEQPLSERRAAQAAAGHGGDGQPYPDVPRVFPELAAAGLWTTPSDLARVIVAVYRASAGQPGSLLSADLAREMLTYQWRHTLPAQSAPPALLSPGMGLGFGLSISPQAVYFSHGGGNLGYLSFFLGRADAGQGAVLMTNSSAGMLLGAELLMSLAEVYGWPDFAAPVQVRASIETRLLAEYAGTYEMEPGRLLKVAAAGDRLLFEIDWFAPQQLEFFARSDTDFFSTQFMYELRFVRDMAGQVTTLVELKDSFPPSRKVMGEQ